jgi:hypothetical protein
VSALSNKRLQQTGISVPLIDNLALAQLFPAAEAQRWISIECRKTMKRLLVSIIGIATLVGFSWIEARACTCDLPLLNLTLRQQVKKAKKQSQAVFVGKVMQVLPKPEGYGVSVKFRVENIWKGKLSQEVTIFTGQGGGDCGYRFEVGESYLVYASGSNERLSTNICQRTAPRSESGDTKVLGKSKIPLR